MAACWQRAGLIGWLTALLAVTAGSAPAVAEGTDIVISGVVYRDVDNDGLQDAGEPGVPGLKVYSGRNSAKNTVTDVDGAYGLALPATWPTSNIFVGTAWFGSQCDALFCGDQQAAGVWVVDNQRIRMKVNPSQGSLPGKNVGLVPDWPELSGQSRRPRARTPSTWQSACLAQPQRVATGRCPR